jgi:hypothetical protein
MQRMGTKRKIVDVQFYKSDTGGVPVKEWLKKLTAADRKDIESSFHGIQRYDDSFTCFYQKVLKNAQERSEDSKTTYVTHSKEKINDRNS